MENKENHYEAMDDKMEIENNSAILYERSRIKALMEQRESVQKKTFTKWINAHLAKCKDVPPIKDLFTDLQDGIVLLKLLEIISGEKLPKPSKGKMRIHCIENLAKSLDFLDQQHVYLENLGAHDIVDGNQTLTMGLIWTLILRFQIQESLPEEYDGKRTSKEALLLWSQMKTAGYPNISIRNFTNSWKDGLAFNAILHRHDPDVVDFVTMTKANPVENMNMAFEIAEREYGVPQLLDAKDIAVDQPDEKIIMTYVGLLSNALNKQKDNKVKCKRLENVINEAIAVEEKINNYEDGCTDLLDWILSKINFMDNEEMGQSLPEVKEQLLEFKKYRLEEKPPKFDELSILEMNFFEIQTKLRNDNRKIYIAPEGKLISDINRAWEDLEKAEHRMDIKLYDELIRQEKLDQLCNRFNRKAQMRETWLQENDRLVQQNIFGNNLVTVDAEIKKHEALEGDIFAHEDRIITLETIAEELDNEKYYKSEEVKSRYSEIKELWDKLLENLTKRRKGLDNCREIQVVLHESEYLLDWIDDIDSRLHTKDYGKHLLGVEDLLEKHKIMSSDIRTLQDRIDDVVEKIASSDPNTASIDPDKLSEREDLLKQSFKDLLKVSTAREDDLLKYKTVWELIEELDNDKEWIKEISQLMQSPDIGHDLASVERLIRKHDQIFSDVSIRTENIDRHLENARHNRDSDVSTERQELIKEEIEDVNMLLENLGILTDERREKLQESLTFFQLLADTDDTDTMIVEERRMFDSTDVGDKQSMTEFYLQQFDEQMIQVHLLEESVDELQDRKDNLKEASLDKEQKTELDNSFEKMIIDLRDLLELTKDRKHLLDKSLIKFHLLNDIDSVETWIVAKEKFLQTLVLTDDFDELNVIKHRFDCFIDQMKLNAEKLCQINDVSTNLIDTDHPEAQKISDNQNNINQNWNELADLTASKQKELDQSMAYNMFLIECKETYDWIDDKKNLLKWTDDLNDDLDGIMQLQRRLGSLQRDVQAVEAKVDYLNDQADDIKAAKPETAARIDSEIGQVNDIWAELKKMLEERDTRLNSSNELQKFLQDLDAFNVWLSNKQRDVASQDIPNDLQEAEKLQTQHQQVRDEIQLWSPEFSRLLEFGRNLSGSKDDAQHLLFNQRLNSLEDGWKMLEEMCNDKDDSLQQSIDAQIFIRDSLYIDSMLTKQETFLAKDNVSPTLEALQNSIREFDTFRTSVASNQPKIESVLSYGESLINNNTLSDKISHKCDQIKDRCKAIQQKINKRDKALQDELKLKMYLEDVMDLEEWIAEKMIIAVDTSYRDAKDISTRYNRFKDFEHELEASKGRVDDVIQTGEDLIEKCPDLEWEIEPKIEQLNNQWSELMQTAQEKCNAMEDANREIIFDQSAKSIMTWVTEISSQIITTDVTTEEMGLVEISEMMKDQESKDAEFDKKRKLLSDLENHAIKLKEQYPDREEEFEQVQKEVHIKLTEIGVPMTDRREKLFQHKSVQQLLRDLQDEKQWIEEKEDFIRINRVWPDSLQICLQKIRRLRTLSTEIENHEARIDDCTKTAQVMIDEGHPNSDKFKNEIQELDQMWTELLDCMSESQNYFNKSKEVQEYLADAGESETWMTEREFDLMKDEKSKDEEGAQNALRRHDELTAAIEKYAVDICELGDRTRHIGQEELLGWDMVAQRQERLDKMYAGLLDMCLDRRMKLEDHIKLHHLLRSIQDLEEWIAERTVLASSHEVGSEFEHCNLLRDRFAEFAIETNDMGGPRVAEAVDMCDQLIEQGHQDAAVIAGWKDRVNEAWADLLELIETRIQLLKSAWDFFKFMSDSSEIIDRIREKILQIPEAIGKDAKTVASYQRKHAAFVLEMNSLRPHVDSAIETANHLLPLYSGTKEEDLIYQRTELQKLWFTLTMESGKRNDTLMDGTDFYRFSAMVRELLAWMTEIEAQLHVDDRARDVCGVELILGNHRSLKAEIDSRDENRSICISLGRSLIARRHPSRDDIRHKCAEVVAKHFNIKEDWTERQEYLDMILEVYQFAREAAVAESWLMAQEPHIHTTEIGESLIDTLNLIQKHQTLERTLSTQEDRFDALKKLTLFEELNRSLTEDSKLEKKRQKEETLKELIREFSTPPPTPKEVSRKSSEAEIVYEEVVAVQKAPELAVAPRDIDTRKREEVSKSEPREFPPLSPEPMRGQVNRKQEWESRTKKAGNRAWHSLLMCYKDKKLAFFKDEKHFNEDWTTSTYKNERALDLEGAEALVATSYTKKNNVFRLRMKEGGEYLVQAPDEAWMKRWVQVICEAGGVDQSKATSTLPVQSSSFAQDNTVARKKFPTMSRKQQK